MKFIFLFLMMWLLVGNANAAPTVCVKLTTNINCTRSSTPTSTQSEFTVTCDGVRVTGVGLAGNRPSDFSKTYDSITHGSERSDVCWCKILSPVISEWVPSQVGDKTPYEYQYSCPQICSLGFISKNASGTAERILHDMLLSGPFTN